MQFIFLTVKRASLLRTTKFTTFFIMLASFPQIMLANNSTYLTSLAYTTKNNYDMTGFKFALRKLLTKPKVLNFYKEINFHKIQTTTNSINIISLSPAARLTGIYPNGINFFLDFSVGPAIKSTPFIAEKRTGSLFTFQDIASIGTRIKNLDLSLQYIHYSNANLKKPNHSIDLNLVFAVSYYFTKPR